MYGLDGRIALVTGAGPNIGRTIDLRVDGGTLATWGTRSQADPTEPRT